MAVGKLLELGLKKASKVVKKPKRYVKETVKQKEGGGLELGLEVTDLPELLGGAKLTRQRPTIMKDGMPSEPVKQVIPPFGSQTPKVPEVDKGSGAGRAVKILAGATGAATLASSQDAQGNPVVKATDFIVSKLQTAIDSLPESGIALDSLPNYLKKKGVKDNELEYSNLLNKTTSESISGPQLKQRLIDSGHKETDSDFYELLGKQAREIADPKRISRSRLQELNKFRPDKYKRAESERFSSVTVQDRYKEVENNYKSNVYENPQIANRYGEEGGGLSEEGARDIAQDQVESRWEFQDKATPFNGKIEDVESSEYREMQDAFDDEVNMAYNDVLGAEGAHRGSKNHFGSEDYVFHTRTDEYRPGVLRIHELQSDLHNSLRKEGKSLDIDYVKQGLVAEFANAKKKNLKEIHLAINPKGVEGLHRSSHVQNTYETTVKSKAKKLAKQIGSKVSEKDGYLVMTIPAVLALPAYADSNPSEIEDMVREMESNGVDEDTIQQFITKLEGEESEPQEQPKLSLDETLDYVEALKEHYSDDEVAKIIQEKGLAAPDYHLEDGESAPEIKPAMDPEVKQVIQEQIDSGKNKDEILGTVVDSEYMADEIYEMLGMEIPSKPPEPSLPTSVEPVKDDRGYVEQAVAAMASLGDSIIETQIEGFKVLVSSGSGIERAKAGLAYSLEASGLFATIKEFSEEFDNHQDYDKIVAAVENIHNQPLMNSLGSIKVGDNPILTKGIFDDYVAAREVQENVVTGALTRAGYKTFKNDAGELMIDPGEGKSPFKAEAGALRSLFSMKYEIVGGSIGAKIASGIKKGKMTPLGTAAKVGTGAYAGLMAGRYADLSYERFSFEGRAGWSLLEV